MSTNGVELATAWVKLVPTMEGATDSIMEALTPGVAAAEKKGTAAGTGFGTKFKAAVGAVAIGAALTGAFAGLYDVGKTFDTVTDTVRAGTGAQGDALDGLLDVVKDVGAQVPREFEDIGTTVADLNTRLGLTGDDLTTVASQVLEAGRLMGTAVDVNTASAAFKAFGLTNEQVAGGMDALFRASQATGVGMNELANGVQLAAPALTNLGFSFEDSIALMGSLDKAGLNSQQVAASLTRSLTTLAKSGEEPSQTFRRVVDEMQGYIDAGDTASALNLSGQIFGTRGASQFVKAIQDGVLNLDNLTAAAGVSGDTILGVGEETMSFSERWQVTMNTAMTAIEPLATSLFTAISDGLKTAMPTLQALGDWVSENTVAIGIIAGVIGVTLVAAMVAWTASIWASTIALLANPVTWIILAIVALIAAVVALVMNWDVVVAWISDIWSGFIDWISGVIDGFVSWWNDAWAAAGEFFSSMWDGIVAFAQGLWQFYIGWLIDIIVFLIQNWDAIWAEAGRIISEAWGNIVGWVSDAIANVRDTIMAVVNAIVSWWTGVWEGVGSFFRGIWDGLVGVVRNVGSVFGSVFTGVRDTIANAFNGIVSIVKAPINGIIGLVNGAIGALNRLSVTIPDWVPFVGGQTWGLSLPRIPMLAAGATVLPRSGGTLAVLAEAGRPESVVDTGLMNRALEEGLDGSGSRGMTVQGPLVQVENMTVDSDDRVEEVAQELWERAQRAERAKGNVNLEGAVVE
ncbi:phage tail tape measure protein [Microbacterium schleiferi]|uniref:Phage tail tape measure protein n=1 Tax=Microbacterium schleiferi TaxID=69362 RepID=A0A7S8MX27_9MICO|nr:phage tail tape measure protein [Microbacterium schleiferi]QPE04135.1 phage tail tape measure protein [Microbacterium schleiferi]